MIPNFTIGVYYLAITILLMCLILSSERIDKFMRSEDTSPPYRVAVLFGFIAILCLLINTTFYYLFGG